MKKVLLTALIASMLIVPLGSTALADHEEPSAPVAVRDYVPGDAPAETTAAEAMLPAVHGLVLAMLNHDAAQFDPADGELAWEGLYNMLSLYGQLDGRCDESDGELLLSQETVSDYAAALDIQPDALSPLPAELQDRITYDAASQSYALICGDEGPVEIQMDSQHGTTLTGSLIYLTNGEVLAHFQAELQPRDTLFGFAIASLTVSD